MDDDKSEEPEGFGRRNLIILFLLIGIPLIAVSVYALTSIHISGNVIVQNPVNPSIAVTTNSLNFGTVGSNQCSTAYYNVTNNGNVNLKLTYANLNTPSPSSLAITDFLNQPLVNYSISVGQTVGIKNTWCPNGIAEGSYGSSYDLEGN